MHATAGTAALSEEASDGARLEGGGPVWALGMMSGTSMDGVDAALLQTDGAVVTAYGPNFFLPYPDEDREMLRRAAAASVALNAATDDLKTAARVVTEAHALAAEALLATPSAPRPAVVGFHGQTVLHRPDQRVTLQIGDAEALARRLSLPVMFDFRSADVAAGGQGAPLAPFYHAALLGRLRTQAQQGADASTSSRPAWDGGGAAAFLNLGGVGNVTWASPEAVDDPTRAAALTAFDTGPANALIDDWMRARGAGAYDRDGAAGLLGRADDMRVAAWIDQAAYVRRPPPKSLDREDFAYVLRALTSEASMSVEDGAATLAEFTAATVAAAIAHLPSPPTLWVVGGGGRRNARIMQSLRRRLAAPVEPTETFGVDGDMVEACAFGHLAVRAARGLPISSPGVTGAPRPLPGGRRAEP